MRDPKEQQKAEAEQVVEDLTVPETQAEEVSGGEVSLPYGHIQPTYTPQKP